MSEKDYYSKKLSAERLKLCYQFVPNRVAQYLREELQCVLKRITANDYVLDLGCGYGRTIEEISRKAFRVVGIDSSAENIAMAQSELAHLNNCKFAVMDAGNPGFRDNSFDFVVCIQNGISAFKVDRRRLFAETVRLTSPGGKILFSSYSQKFWQPRLEWFRIQANKGLIGEIDEKKTKNGKIICRDGFEANTVGEEEFKKLASLFNVTTNIFEVDNSSIFCEMVVNKK